MSLSWPWALLALLAIPLVIAAWWWTRRRRRRGAVRVTSIALVRASLPGRNRWRRLIPAALLLLGLAVLGIGAARPQATVRVPSSSGTIMLALDISGSMCSTDVKPNRITAAEDAASAFIKSEAGGPRIGLVPFAGTAGVLVPPTTDSGTLLHALSGLSTSQGTAIGQGILTSLDAIAQVDPSIAPTGAHPAKARSYAHDVIVVLTDGSNNVGVDPQTAARQAAARGVRVFTIRRQQLVGGLRDLFWCAVRQIIQGSQDLSCERRIGRPALMPRLCRRQQLAGVGLIRPRADSPWMFLLPTALHHPLCCV